jgi:hypothetical protein
MDQHTGLVVGLKDSELEEAWLVKLNFDCQGRVD